MGGSGFSREKYNARETVISSDFNRMQALASREQQNILADAVTDNSGLPITGLSGPCTLTGITGQFNMALTAAQAFCWNPGDSILTADDSAYEVARWIAQNLLFANPPGSNARIDLVVLTPVMVDTDSQSRNILVDPVARTISPQNVFKTTNPLCVPQIIAGTASATPAPPAVPSGSFALFEVYVPSGAVDSTGFTVCPRMFRRAPYPWATQSGILSGFNLVWDLSTTPGVADSALTFPAFDNCQILIDGEFLQTIGVVLDAVITQDAGSNNPFGAAAPANWHQPYYIYAVGGRHAPQGGAFGCPIAIIESLVPPSASSGHPTSAITTPRGSTTQLGAVYIGLGAVCANTTKRLPCVMDEEFTILTEVSPITPINLLTHAAGSSNFEAFDTHAPPLVPVISDLAKVQVGPGTTVTNGVFVAPDNGAGTGPAPGFQTAVLQPILPAQTLTGPVQINSGGVLPMSGATPKFWVATNAGSGTTLLYIQGYNHRIRRLHY